jgi:alkaline phosphatase D
MKKLYIVLFFLFPNIIKSQSPNAANNKYRSEIQLQQSIIEGMKNSIGNLNRDKNLIFDKSTFSIAFGSCSSEKSSLPILNNVVKHDPDLFIFLGDNIYGDTKNLDTLKNKYLKLSKKLSFQNLIKNIPVIATWDDHDYGWNDIGKDYILKNESKEIFLNFFGEGDSSSRRTHEGIYHSYYYQIKNKIVQIILLDLRTFRDDLVTYNGEFKDDLRYSFYKQDYAPNFDKDFTILGDQQWVWLEKELKINADVRIIGSSTQFGIEWNGYESWENFPNEKQKMLQLINKTRANNLFFISGDVHYSEISKTETDFYPIYDFTSSGLSSTWHYATPNNNRIEGPVMDNHFGLITIDITDSNNEFVKFENWDINDNQRFEYSLDLKSIDFKK